MNFLRFLISRTFWLQLLIVVALIVVALLATNLFLGSYTGKGRIVTVPDLSGRTEAEVRHELKKFDLETIMVDSVFNLESRPGAIIDQTPKAGKKVKRGRKIYITINAFGKEMTTMPDLITNSSFRNAKAQLETLGLVVGKVDYEPQAARNDLVLRQSMNGKPIEAGTRIPKGSVIDLVVALDSKEEYIVPDLSGLALVDATVAVSNCYFSLGSVVCDETVKTKADSLTAVVYRQSPTAASDRKELRGTAINLWLTKDMSKLQISAKQSDD